MEGITMDAELTFPEEKYFDMNLLMARVVTYFRLRPELSLFIASFIFLFISLFAVRWSDAVDYDDFTDLSRFEMVELQIPVQETTQPEIALPDEVDDAIMEEEEQLKFGDDSGKYDNSAMAITPPEPKVSALPSYPKSMRNAGVEGIVVVEVGIDEAGTIVYGKIVKKLHPTLDRLVIAWIQNVSFYPALDKDGKPFRCKIFWPIRFQLY